MNLADGLTKDKLKKYEEKLKGVNMETYLKKQIYSKIINISRKVKPISKDHKNIQQNFKFRGIDDVYNALQPLMSEEGVFVTSRVVHSEREERKTRSGGLSIYSILDIEFNFIAEDGSFVSCTTRGEAMDSGDKASNKAMSTALKYALLQMFMIPTQESIDTDKDSPDPLPKKENGNVEKSLEAMRKFTDPSNLAKFASTFQNFEWTAGEKETLSIEYKKLYNKLLEVENGNNYTK